MDMREWLSIVVIIAIVLILLDGFRRKWLERRRSLRFKLDKNIPSEKDNYDYDRNNELPNGGARSVGEDDRAPYYGSSEDGISDEIDQDDDLADEGYADDDEYLEDSYLEEDTDIEFQEEDLSLSNANTFSEQQAVPTLTDSVEEELSESELEPDYASESFSKEADVEQTSSESLIEDDASADDYFEDEFDDQVESMSAERIEPSFGENFEADNFEDSFVAEKRHEQVSDSREVSNSEPVSYTKDDQKELFVDYADDTLDAEAEPEAQGPQEVIVLNVMSKAGEMLAGHDLLPILMQQGLRLGDMSIFHRYGDVNGNGPVMFSMANMVEPGTFDISQMETFSTPGISFFLQLPNSLGNMQCFEKMLDAANAIKEGLNADLKDEDRNMITRQTLEHSRERIRDFELKQLSRK